MSSQPLRVTGYLSLGGVQYPFDETLTVGQTVNLNNAGCSYHLSLTSNAGGVQTPELWIDSFIGANLPMYGEVIVNPPAGFSGAVIGDRSSTASVNQMGNAYYDGTQGALLGLAAPWTASAYAFSDSGIFPTQSFGMGVANSSGFTAPALYLGFGANFTLPAPVAPAEAIAVLANSTDNSVAPTITQGGSSVAADSMTVITQPAHGAASASGTTLTYTPDTGYVGADSFTYKATVDSQDSNTATVSVLVTPPEKFMIELRTSKDGAHNFGYWRQYDMGPQGQFNNQPVFRRLGNGRRIVMHIRASVDRGRDIVACSVDTEPF